MLVHTSSAGFTVALVWEEVYYILEGQGLVQVGDEDRPVSPGSTVFVDVGVEHRFHSIAQDLNILVFWAPPWRSQAPAS